MKTVIKIILPLFLLFASGCMSWNEGWKTEVKATGTGDIKALLTSAASIESTADFVDKVKNVIAAYEKVITIDPGNFMALNKAAEFAYLYAYIYSDNKSEKEEYYTKTLQYCERAMYTNPEFKKLADQGKPAWECASSLTSKEIEAMFYWYVAAGQYWTQCLNSFSKLLNFYWPSRANLILKRMTAINADWGNGRVHMSWGAFYSIAPGFLGGDMKKAEEEFAKAVQYSPDYLNNYFVRAKYLYVKKGDREAFKKDLEHIISTDIKKINFEYAWGAAYQMKAKELLGETDRLFK